MCLKRCNQLLKDVGGLFKARNTAKTVNHAICLYFSEGAPLVLSFLLQLLKVENPFRNGVITQQKCIANVSNTCK
jgi:hypothetical protein